MFTTMTITTTTTTKTTTAITKILFCGGAKFRNTAEKVVHSKQRQINLSSKTFSKEVIGVLEKGFKFTPTPNPDNKTLEKDINDFCRQLRLREIFKRAENF